MIYSSFLRVTGHLTFSLLAKWVQEFNEAGVQTLVHLTIVSLAMESITAAAGKRSGGLPITCSAGGLHKGLKAYWYC